MVNRTVPITAMAAKKTSMPVMSPRPKNSIIDENPNNASRPLAGGSLRCFIKVLFLFQRADVNDVVVSVNDGAKRPTHQHPDAPGRQLQSDAEQEDDEQSDEDECLLKEDQEDV